MAKRGPRTDAGRAAVRLNALRHGISADSPVIAGLEHEADWQAHLQGTLDSLTPAGHLEQELAQRIALLLWRLRRVARYERQAIEVNQDRIVHQIHPGETTVEMAALLAHMAGKVADPEQVLREEADSVDRRRAWAVRERLLPADDVIAKVTRYESHLHRQLLQTMHELEAMRARRQGAVTPLARLDLIDTAAADI